MRVRGQGHVMATLPLGKCPPAHCTVDWVGTQGRSGQVWRKDNLYPLPKIEHRAAQPVPSLYTEYAASTPGLCTKFNTPIATKHKAT